MTDPTRFFITGGTLAVDAPSYVERQADLDLFEGLRRSDFCYVLTPRQMGKSSLMVRTAARLREAGVTVAILDLTSVGQLLTQEQWYYGLLQSLASQLRLREPLKRFWLENPLLGPLQRWMAAIREVVLPHLNPEPETASSPTGVNGSPPQKSRLVIFVDEIDAVRSLPFSTDELFAAIRECYNRRPHDPEMHRLTFCLVGVATPSDLIQDPRTTPFNIGVRVELEDFTDAEAAPLTAGLVVGRAESLGRSPEEARQVLKRILYWTSGHPYLTQRLCLAMVETLTERGTAGVDRVCESLFLAPGARERDDNLILVRERILRTEGDLGGVLDLYSCVWGRKRVKDNSLNPAVVTLRLSGIVKGSPTGLIVRNRIYAQAFDRDWIQEITPGGELRRQRTAYQKGMLRAALVFGAALTALMATLFGLQQFKRAEVRGRALRLNRYARDIGQAEKAVRSGDMARARELLDTYRPKPGQEDLRGFEWRYLRSLANRNHVRVALERTGIHQLHFLPDGNTVLSAESLYKSTRFDSRTGAKLGYFAGPAELNERGLADPNFTVFNPALTADGKRLCRTYGTFEPENGGRGVWTFEVAGIDQQKGSKICAVEGWPGEPPALSPDGSLLAFCRREARVPVSQPAVLEIWNVTSRRRISAIKQPELLAWRPRFSRDGRQLALAIDGGVVRVWKVRPTGTLSEAQTLTGHVPRATSHEFSPDGTMLAVGTGAEFGAGEKPGLVMLWDLKRGQVVGTLAGHQGTVTHLAFSHEGRLVISASRDQTVKIWDVHRRLELETIPCLAGQPTALAVSPKSRRLGIAEVPARVHFLDLPRVPEEPAPVERGRGYASLSFLPSELLAARALLPPDIGWRVRDGLLLQESGRKSSKSYALSIHTGRIARIVTGGIEVRDLKSGRKQWFPASTGPHPVPRFSRDGSRLLISGPRGNVSAIDLNTGKLEEWLRLESRISQLAIGGSDVVTALSNHGQLQVRVQGSQPEIVRAAGVMMPVSVSPDGHLVSFVETNGVVVRVLATGEELRFPATYGHTPGGQTRVALCPGNRTIAISSAHDRSIRLCSLQTGADLVSIRPLPAEVTAMSFNDDGSKLAIACGDGSVIVIPPDQ